MKAITKISTDKYALGGFRARNLQAIFTPKRTKFKGYMRENRRSTFNKNR